MTRNRLIAAFISLVFTVAVFWLNRPAFGAEASPLLMDLSIEPPAPRPLALQDTAHRLKFFIEGGYGYGFDSIHVGDTLSNEKVTLRGGGGTDIAAGIGYGLFQGFDLDLNVGIQTSTLMPDIGGANGSFTRNVLLATLKRKFPLSYESQFKIGLGAGIYSNGEMDIDWSQADGQHGIVTYDDAMGFHLTAEFERFFLPKASFHAGLRLYSVTYTARTYTVDGAPAPLGDLKGNVKELKGGGLNALIGLTQYF